MTGKSEQWNAMRILGERVSPSKITSLGISASRLALSHLGRENQMWCGWTWAGNWWKNKKRRWGKSYFSFIFPWIAAEAFSRSEFPSRIWSLVKFTFIFCCGADAVARDHLIMTHWQEFLKAAFIFITLKSNETKPKNK
jgi:hypothetical protein